MASASIQQRSCDDLLPVLWLKAPGKALVGGANGAEYTEVIVVYCPGGGYAEAGAKFCWRLPNPSGTGGGGCPPP